MASSAVESKEFFTVVTPGEAWRRLVEQIAATGRGEVLPLDRALHRVLAADVASPGDLPTFTRSSMDGYAVRAQDTYGATEASPALLRVAGEAQMGQTPTVRVGAGEAALIHTGGMLPAGADAVAMLEYTQPLGGDVQVLRPVAPGENVVQIGEDVCKGQPMLPAGQVLRPQDLGALAAMGVVSVPVAARPRVAILATGDEVVPPEREPGPGQVRDVNSTALCALVAQAGGEPLPLGIARDDYATLYDMARRGLEAADALVVAAGSSVSTRDMTGQVIAELGRPGVLVHGIALRPGKPTILAVAGGKPVFGLPGNPVSALVVAGLFLVPAIHRLAGRAAPPPRPTIAARLAQNIPSVAGREDYVPVRLVARDGETWAEAVFGKSNLIFTTVRADGWICVPLDRGGLVAGDMVAVTLYE